MSFTFIRRHLTLALLGFASGLPLALTGQTLQAWLTAEQLDITTIGFLGLVAIPYSLKFLWAPLMDRFEPALLGRRRGWLVITQWALALALWCISTVSPTSHMPTFAVLALVVAFLSASQDIVFDAYRSDLLPAAERGVGTSLSVFGYRIAMITSGGIAFIWAEQWGNWTQVYKTMSVVFVALGGITILLAPRCANSLEGQIIHSQQATQELIGFCSLILSIATSIYLVNCLWGFANISLASAEGLLKLLIVLTQIATATIAAAISIYYIKFSTLQAALLNYLHKPQALLFLLLIVLYKLGDAFAGSLLTPFLLRDMNFSSAEIGIVNKVIGIWITIFGALFGGVLLMRIHLYKALLIFGLLQLVSNMGYWLLAISGKNAWGQFELQSFNIMIASLDHATHIDFLLCAVIIIENLSGGMGTAAFVALLMTLCNARFSATQFALLSALSSLGRIYVSPIAGIMAPAMGWPVFFIFSTLIAVPGIWMVWALKNSIIQLESDK